MPESMSRGNSLTTDTGDATHPSSPRSLTMNLHVGVLHYDPSFEPFPLLTDPVNYEPNTVDISGDKDMLDYWLTVLSDSIPTIMAKAVASEGGKPGTSLPPPLPPPAPCTLPPNCRSIVMAKAVASEGSKPGIVCPPPSPSPLSCPHLLHTLLTTPIPTILARLLPVRAASQVRLLSVPWGALGSLGGRGGGGVVVVGGGGLIELRRGRGAKIIQKGEGG